MINLMIALPREASPLIGHYRLKRENTVPHPLYLADRIRLIVSGIGQEKAARTVEYLKERFPERNQGWLNLGIAGHGTMEIGRMFVAGRILRFGKQEVFHPPQVYHLNTQISELTTSDEPVHDYEKNMGYDMEAHGFYKAACEASTRELVQVLKIVSDNPQSPLSDFRPQKATRLIEQNMERIDKWIEAIELASEEIKPCAMIDQTWNELLEQAHFTATRSHQLHTLLRQGRALGVDLTEIQELCREVSCPKLMLARIEEFIGPFRSLA